MEICDDRHPQAEIIFGGKNEHRAAENIDAEEFIAKKGLAAKGKKVSQYEVKSVRFIEPLHKPEDDIEENGLQAEDNGTGADINAAQAPADEDITDVSGMMDDDDQPTLF